MSLAFAISITFNGKKTSDIGDSAIVPITIIKKSQLSNINTKNKNKKKKNNQKLRHNNKNISQF